MRRVRSVLVGALGLLFVLAMFELFVPSAKGLLPGFLGLLGIMFKELFLKDTVRSVILFSVLAFSCFGTFYLSRKEENKLWGIVSAVVSVAAFIGLLVH